MERLYRGYGQVQNTRKAVTHARDQHSALSRESLSAKLPFFTCQLQS